MKRLYFPLNRKLAVTALTLGLCTALQQLHAQARLVLNGNVVVNLDGGSSSTPIYLVVDNSASNAITSSGNGRINSEGEFNIVRWNIGSSTGNYVIPFGDNSGNLLPWNLNITSAGSLGGSIAFSTYPTAVNNTPHPTGVTSMSYQNDPNNLIAPGSITYDRFWIANSNHTDLPSGTMDFTYLPSAFTGGLTPSSILAAQFHDGTEWSLNQYGTDNQLGQVSSVPTINLGIWTLTEFGANPLPITLLSFNAVWNDARQTEARIFWSTASELNNDYFDVERSADGSFWQHIDRVQGAGTSTQTLNYEILDKNPLNGISYYRLRQVDFDGNATYSHVVALKKDINGAAISVYPNPAENQFQIAFEGFQSENVSINILDNAGRIVQKISNNVLTNPVQVINTRGFQSGVYNIHVTSEKENFIQRIVIKN
jgi:hypothetical protein